MIYSLILQKIFNMKKSIKLLVLLMAALPAFCFAQEKKSNWPQMKTFHGLMSSTFHPAEDGNLLPLREKADSLYIVAKLWEESTIPSDFKPAETAAALKKLAAQCASIKKAVRGKTSDPELKSMITSAHETFHTLVGECRKADH
jgi:hypothetical protein